MESRTWAPSHWSTTRIRLTLTHARRYVRDLPADGSHRLAGITDALMTFDIALSEVEMTRRPWRQPVWQDSSGGRPKGKIIGFRRITSPEA